MAEKPIDPRIDEALKKCNPQKAIYALAEVENEVIDQLATTEGTLNTRMDGIETDMDNLEASVNTRITGIEGVANEANTKASNAVTTANQANATANQALTNSETTQTNLTTLEGVVDTAFNAVGNTESTSTVNVDLTTIGGQKKTTALPVASAGKAGVINTSDYIKFEGYDARIKSLEGQSITYLVQFPNNNPTQAEITAAYRAQYPNAPFPPLDSTVLMDTANELSYRWFENSQTWSKISAEPIGLFTLQKEGLIKGSDKVGEVYPNADGTGAVNGWDALGTRVTNAEAAITANTNLANSKGAQLNSSATATGVNVNLLNTAGTQIGTTALPVASESQAGIVNAATMVTINALAKGSIPNIISVNSNSLTVINKAGTQIFEIIMDTNDFYTRNYTGETATVSGMGLYSVGYYTGVGSGAREAVSGGSAQTINVSNGDAVYFTNPGITANNSGFGILTVKTTKYSIIIFTFYICGTPTTFSGPTYSYASTAIVFE